MREEVNAQGVRVVQVAPVLVHNDAGVTDKAAPESHAAGNQVKATVTAVTKQQQ